MIKRVCGLTLALMLLMCTPVLAYVGFDINGRDYISSSAPVLRDGITSATAQMIAKTLGAQLTIEGDKITLIENQDVLQMTVGNQTALLNGKEKHMSCAPELSGENVLLPVRFVYECFGAKVNWLSDEQKVAVTYMETRNNMLPEDMLAESSRVMLANNTYKISVDVKADIDVNTKETGKEAQTASSKMTGHIDGSIQYKPIVMYLKQNMKMDVPEAGADAIDMTTEMVMNADGLYMTLPEQGWVKMEIPGMDMEKLMEQSMAQDPISSMKQMKEAGMAVAFDNDGQRNGQKYWIVDVTMSPDAMNKYLQGSAGEIPGLDQSLLDMYKNLSLDMTYQTWINQKTLTADYMVLNAKYNFGMDSTEGENPGHMDMDMDASYQLYDFGVSINVPDVSGAKDLNEVVEQPAATK